MSSLPSTNLDKVLAALDQDPITKTHILHEVKGNRLWITLNRPKRYNAFTPEMYVTLRNIIVHGNEHNDVKFIIINGQGGNYSSGNDLGNFTNPTVHALGNTEDISKMFAEALRNLGQAIIRSKKPIFAIAEGKVIGFAFTQLALFDKVFATSTANFRAPLVVIAQGQEMCSSYTFPKIFGKALGQDLIMKGKTVDAAFLEKHGFLTAVKDRAAAEEALQAHLKDLQNLEWNSYMKARELFRVIDRQQLLQANDRECQNLVERWCNPELPGILVEYMQRVKTQPKL